MGIGATLEAVADRVVSKTVCVPSPADEVSTSAPTAPPTRTYIPFSYNAYVTYNNTSPVVHLCRDLQSLEAAVELLKGETIIGMDIEHEPFGADKGTKEPREKSKAAQKLAADANEAGQAAYDLYVSTHPDTACTIKRKKGLISGIKVGDIYHRMTRYTKTRISVLQLASAAHIVIAHFAAFDTNSEIMDASEFIPPNLKTMFLDSNVLKIGVQLFGFDSDTECLSRYFDLPSQGLLELNDLHDTIRPTSAGTPKRRIGLRRLTEMYLDRTLIGKGDGSTTTSEWQLPQPLSQEQIDYAANDAFVSVKIYEAMMQERSSMRLIPTFPECKSQGEFDFQELEEAKIKQWKESGTAGAKKQLAKRGLGQAPVPPQFKREEMKPCDNVLAANLAALRDRLLLALGKPDPQRYWILENKLVDRIALKHPRPQSNSELMAMLPNKARQTIEPYVDEFMRVIREHNDMDYGFGLSAKEGNVEKAHEEAEVVEIQAQAKLESEPAEPCSSKETQDRRSIMRPQDVELADALSSLRDDILKQDFNISAQAAEKRWLVIADRDIDTIAQAMPRPQEITALLALVKPASKRKRLERFGSQFLKVIAAHGVLYDQLTIELEDKGLALSSDDSDSTA